MKIRVEDDTVHIEGYVNAVERKSKPLWSRFGEFTERICKGAFARALERADDVRILLNHDWTKDLGGTATGELELVEDPIGLRACAHLTHPEVVKRAQAGELAGWSFGFKDRKVRSVTEQGASVREVEDLDLYEVSLLAGKNPAYEGTLVTVREEDAGNRMFYGLPQSVSDEAEPETRSETDPTPDWSEAEQLLKEIKETR